MSKFLIMVQRNVLLQTNDHFEFMYLQIFMTTAEGNHFPDLG